MKIAYIEKNFKQKTFELIMYCNSVIAEYTAQGYSLTLRQLYYQLVARDIVPNNQRSYKRVGGIVSDGRRAGLISWSAIEDRTRNLKGNTHWKNPKHVVKAAIDGYEIDKWSNQKTRVEVWVEKEALAAVVQRVAGVQDVNFFSCRGYPSDSEMHSAALRFQRYNKNKQHVVVLHLGDHDPSGIDMTRDIKNRLRLFEAFNVQIKRIALNMDQIKQYNPPPNFAKATDSRFGQYTSRFGTDSWELDALPPDVLAQIITGGILEYRDEDRWAEMAKKEAGDIEQLKRMIDQN